MKYRILAAVFVATALMQGASPLEGQLGDKLQVHGYLTQAAGSANGGTFLGIPEDGTTDYRNAALQFRYAFTSKDNMTLQLQHRRLGENPAVVGTPNIFVDWAYYGRNLGDLYLRVGRVPIPAGIYNEIRDVGVLLPLYRAPFNFYLEGMFTSETVDGVVASYQFLADRPWNIEVSGFAGGWQMIDRIQVDTVYVGVETQVKNGLGGQVWLNTALEGLRVGFGAQRQDVKGGQFAGDWSGWHASLDANFDLFTLQGEYRTISPTGVDYEAYYGYLGVHATRQLTLHGQADFAQVTLEGFPKMDWNEAYTVGASYAFSPNLVLKGEGHFTKGYWGDAPVVNAFAGQAPAEIDYWLLSLSVGF